MLENKDNKVDELEENTHEAASENESSDENFVNENQQSMFDTADAFSDSMVVEKEQVEIDSSADDKKVSDGSEFGDTAVFTFAKDKPAGTEIEHEELSVSELQGTAKDYYNATHSDSIEDKIDALRKFADGNFESDDAFENVSVEETAAAVEVDKKALKQEKKKNKKEKHNRRKGIVSDDDIVMLSGIFDNGENASEVQSTQGVYDETTNSTEYTNPLGTDDAEEETEEDELIKALGDQNKQYKNKYEEFFGKDEPDEEYTDRNQESIILKGLRSRAFASMFSALLTLVVTAFCIYFEAASGTKAAHPEFFEAGKYGVTYALSMLQFMFVAIMLNLDGVKRAFKGLRPSKASVEGFTAAVVAVCTLHTVLSCIIVPDSPELKTFCSVGCVSLLLLSVNSFVKAYTSLTSFCIAASKSPKTAAFVLGRDSLEAHQFEKYLDEDTTIITVGKGDFVKGFFKKSCKRPVIGSSTFKTALVAAAVALIAGVVKGFMAESVYAGVCTFTLVCLAALPANALISTALPYFFASVKAKRIQTAFIGEAACDAYESCGIISFDDVEVFSPKNVKVSSIRTYGENRIDKVILYIARVFDKLEGPLSHVFAKSVQNIEDGGIEAQIVEHFSDGISAKIDGKDILVGTDAFMKLYDIETTTDNIDESFVQSCGSIMYMAVDGELAAKYYVKYAINRGFEDILRAFYDAGVCVGVKTLDPCITTELICANLKGTNYPVSVIKNCASAPDAVADEADSALISLSGIHNFLRGYIKLDHLRNVYRANYVVSIVSIIIGLVVSIVFGMFNAMELGLAFVVVFQLFWCLPTVLISIFSK